MMDHTPEPWEDGDSNRTVAQGKYIAQFLQPAPIENHAAANNMRRANLCVNACAGLSDNQLTELGIGGVKAMVDRLLPRRSRHWEELSPEEQMAWAHHAMTGE